MSPDTPTEPVTPPTEPEAPAVAPAPQPAPAPAPNLGTVNTTQSQTDLLGIFSLICAFIGLSLIGFILGLVGVSQANKQGRSATLSKVGWILNLVFFIIGVLIFGTLFIIGLTHPAASTTTYSTY